MKRNKTYLAQKGKIERKWYLVDAEGKILGRLATRVATILRGKHKPIFTPQVDCGDFVVVINAREVKVSGKKETGKFYFRHSGYPAGHTLTSVEKTRATHPEQIIQSAVRGMLPKGRLGRAVFKKLKVYASKNHPHQAQKLEKLEV